MLGTVIIFIVSLLLIYRIIDFCIKSYQIGRAVILAKEIKQRKIIETYMKLETGNALTPELKKEFRKKFISTM